jgi:hypothetical protein
MPTVKQRFGFAPVRGFLECCGQRRKNAKNHCRIEFLGTQPVTAADHFRHRRKARCIASEILGQRHQHILEQGLAIGARLLAAVEHGNRLGRCRQGRQQSRRRPRAEQANLEHADLLALPVHVLYGFLHRFGPEPIRMMTRSASGAPT